MKHLSLKSFTTSVVCEMNAPFIVRIFVILDLVIPCFIIGYSNIPSERLKLLKMERVHFYRLSLFKQQLLYTCKDLQFQGTSQELLQ